MLCYEISKESFKQRLEERGNFFLFELFGHESGANTAHFKEVVAISNIEQLGTQLQQSCPNKSANLLFFSLIPGSQQAKKAAHQAAELGYHFCYYYQGSIQDQLLDKGLN